MSIPTKPISRRASRREKSLKSKAFPGPLPPKKSRRSSYLVFLCLGLALITVTVYSQVAWHPFVNYDDGPYVTANTHVTAGLTWDTLAWALRAYESGNWHPLTWMSHATDCEFYGLNAGKHHLTSLSLHVLNVLVLFLLLQRATGATWKSFFVAALFALHPLNVESVAWIAERKNVLSTFFFLMTLGAYGWYSRKPEIRRYLVVAILFVLALASKPMVITLPFVLLLLDYWPLQRIRNWSAPSQAFPVPQQSFLRLVVEKAPLLLLCAASAMVTVAAQGTSVIPAHVLPFEVRLETSFYAYALYLWKMIWPVDLALIYPHPGRSLGLWKPAIGFLLAVGISLLAWVQRLKRPYFTIGWMWFLGTAVPIIGIVQVGLQIIADRYAYIPLIGLFICVVWSVSLAAEESQLGRITLAVPAAILLALLAVVTWRQVGYWRDSVTLWTHALDVTGSNSIAENYLANTLFTDGRYEEGMAHLKVYASLEPFDPEAHARVGADFQDHGKFQDAVREYELAIKASSEMERNGIPGLDSSTLAITYLNLGLTYRQVGAMRESAESTRRALTIDQNAVAKTLRDFTAFLQSRPSAPGYVRLGMLLQNVGNDVDASQAFSRARQLDPAVSLPSL